MVSQQLTAPFITVEFNMPVDVTGCSETFVAVHQTTRDHSHEDCRKKLPYQKKDCELRVPAWDTGRNQARIPNSSLLGGALSVASARP